MGDLILKQYTYVCFELRRNCKLMSCFKLCGHFHLLEDIYRGDMLT